MGVKLTGWSGSVNDLYCTWRSELSGALQGSILGPVRSTFLFQRSAKFCTWEGRVPCNDASWGLTGWGAALLEQTQGAVADTKLSISQQHALAARCASWAALG